MQTPASASGTDGSLCMRIECHGTRLEAEATSVRFSDHGAFPAFCGLVSAPAAFVLCRPQPLSPKLFIVQLPKALTFGRLVWSFMCSWPGSRWGEDDITRRTIVRLKHILKCSYFGGLNFTTKDWVAFWKEGTENSFIRLLEDESAQPFRALGSVEGCSLHLL